MMGSDPDRLAIDKADRELYAHDTIQREILADRENKEKFLFAMAIGFKNRVKRSLDVREGFFLAKNLRAEEEALIDAVAIYADPAVVLSDRQAVFRIAEEYAHAGIRLLYDEATSGQPGSYFKKLELDLFTLLDTLDLD